jgi:hypothetical protein
MDRTGLAGKANGKIAQAFKKALSPASKMEPFTGRRIGNSRSIPGWADRERPVLRTLLSATIMAGALAGNAMAQDVGCALPSEPEGLAAALDAAISGPADKDRACMKALLIPEARMMFVSRGADGAPKYTLQTLDAWIARTQGLGREVLEEKQLKFHIERFGDIAHLWSSYALRDDGKQIARGINSIEAVKAAGGWRVTSIMVQAESAAAPLPKKYLP